MYTHLRFGAKLYPLPALSMLQVVVTGNETGSECALAVQRGILHFDINEVFFIAVVAGYVNCTAQRFCAEMYW